jgi:hypothetical protein
MWCLLTNTVCAGCFSLLLLLLLLLLRVQTIAAIAREFDLVTSWNPG